MTARKTTAPTVSFSGLCSKLSGARSCRTAQALCAVTLERFLQLSVQSARELIRFYADTMSEVLLRR